LVVLFVLIVREELERAGNQDEGDADRDHDRQQPTAHEYDFDNFFAYFLAEGQTAAEQLTRLGGDRRWNRGRGHEKTSRWNDLGLAVSRSMRRFRGWARPGERKTASETLIRLRA